MREQVELLGEQGLRKVKTKSLLFVAKKETKGCGQKAVGKGAWPVGGTALRAV